MHGTFFHDFPGFHDSQSSWEPCFGTQKNCLTETVLLSTNNICFGLEIRKKIKNALLSGGLIQLQVRTVQFSQYIKLNKRAITLLKM